MKRIEHATCVRIGEAGLLLRGASGAGKSDIAYRLICEAREEEVVRLVADDQVCLTDSGSGVMASAPPELAGLLELRGLGLVHLQTSATARIVLVVELVGRDLVPRLAEPAWVDLCGHDVPVIRLHGHDASTPAKIRLAMRTIAKHGFPGDDGLIDRP